MRVPTGLLYGLLAVLFVSNLLYLARNTHRLLWADAQPQITFDTVDRGNVVRVAAEGLPLKKGDRIERINGLPFRGFAQVDRARWLAKPGDLLFLDIDSQGEKRRVAIPWPAGSWPNLNAAERAAFGFMTLVPWFSLFFGVWVVWLRPRDPFAWLFLFLMLSVTRFTDAGGTGWEDGVRQVTIFFNVFLADINSALFLLLGMFFGYRWPGSKMMAAAWIVVALKFADAFLNALQTVWTRERGREADAVHSFVRDTVIFSDAINYLGYGLMFYLLFGKYLTPLTSPDLKRRLRILLFALNFSLAPAFLYFASRSIFEIAYPRWVNVLTFTLLSIIPLSLAYVILVHRAVDVGVALRTGLQYTMARGGVLFLQLIVAVIGIIWAVRYMEDQHHLGSGVHAAILASYAGLLFLIRWISGPLFRRIDRFFFRDAYSSEQLLADLTDKIRTVLEPQELFATVSQRLGQALHVEEVTFFLRGSSGFAPAYATGGAAAGTFPPDSPIAQKLALEHEPMQLYLDDPQSWANALTTPAAERERLVSLNTQVLLPLSSASGLLGFASLGPKRSEAPYTRNDLRLLKAVATQAGLALENSRLATSLAEEAAQKEGAHRELEIASQVQQRLFPQKPLVTGRVEIAGSCRPALAVGGDYFDYFPLENGASGFAVGDVAGKGLGAALVMATLQASLRTQVLDGDPDLAGLIVRLNRVVYEASTRNRFATLFYAQYDPATGTLAYVNAGHNPPFVIRASGAIERLQLTGIAVGLRRKQPYTQATLTLHPGDLVIAFTDGISEAMNAAQEEWGEDRLKAHLAKLPTRKPTEILKSILAAADAFVAGADQHDDMTMVVMRIKYDQEDEHAG